MNKSNQNQIRKTKNIIYEALMKISREYLVYHSNWSV